MVTKDNKAIKLIDFGSCKDLSGTPFEKMFEEERKKSVRQKPYFKNFVGTPQYMAPECVHNTDTNEKSDSWSLGCLLYQLFIGFPPFLGKSDYLIFLKSTEVKYNIPQLLIPEDAKDLIQKLLLKNQNARLSVKEMLEHPFLKNYVDSQYNKGYPVFDLNEVAYSTITQKIVKKYKKHKGISVKLCKIQENERMNQDNKTHNNLTKDNEIIINVKEKEELQVQYEKALNDLESEVDDKIRYIKEHIMNEVKAQYYCCKYEFFKKQIKHEIFNIDINLEEA